MFQSPRLTVLASPGEAGEAWETDAMGPRVFQGDALIPSWYPVLCESLGKPPSKLSSGANGKRVLRRQDRRPAQSGSLERAKVFKYSLCGLSSCE